MEKILNSAAPWMAILLQLLHVIYYASHVLNPAQMNYATTEKELMAVVYAFDKFRSYLLGSKVIVYTSSANVEGELPFMAQRNLKNSPFSDPYEWA